MPSPVGHALGAVAVGWAVGGMAPEGRALRVQAGLLAALAIAPDLDLLIGRHSRETHSVGAAVLAASVAAAAAWPLATTRLRIWLTAFCAWFSHPMLDALAPDNAPPIGVMILWPFSTTHWQTGLAIFAPIWRDWTDPAFLPHDTAAVARELLILGPIVALTWHWRRRHSGRT